MKRKFEGIWIPRDIWLSDSLTLQEKVFLVEINSLDNEKGCYANNEYFSHFFGISKTRVSMVINSLVEKGFIVSFINSGEGNKRTLKTLLNFSLRPSSTSIKDPLKQSCKYNNTVNNTSNSTVNKDTAAPASGAFEKGKETSSEQQKKDYGWNWWVDAYMQLMKRETGKEKPAISIADYAGLKNIRKALVYGEGGEEQAQAEFLYIIQHWAKLDNYRKGRLRAYQINSELVNIQAYIRNSNAKVENVSEFERRASQAERVAEKLKLMREEEQI